MKLKQNSISILKTRVGTSLEIIVSKLKFNKLKDLKLVTGITILVIISTISSLILGGLGLFNSQINNSNMSKLYNNNLIPIKNVGELRKSFLMYRLGIDKILQDFHNSDTYLNETDIKREYIKKITKDFNLNIEIVPCPTLRENSGLALSSRNARLSLPGHNLASKIFEGLNHIKNNINSHSVSELKLWFKNHIEQEPSMKVEYIEICDADSLKILTDVSGSLSVVACTAVYLENVRLIDNLKIF